MLGFTLHAKAGNDAVAIVRNEHDVELNLVYNANADAGGKNILMDVGEKYPGYTHVALRVASIKAAILALRENGVRITQERLFDGMSIRCGSTELRFLAIG